MRSVAPPIERAVEWFNARVGALHSSPRWGKLVGRRITVVTYTGRRSGRRFSTPVEYRRHADTVRIGVRMPDTKNWWRNFTDPGGPISLGLDGAERGGHAIAHRDESGKVTVTVRLEG
ncbi:hypothetical protein [Sciscionella sediminilitoris]|uniref:hypothetical protein n=1 Tax=Sciscionella sediminilitoris TaxID=1445613 RepID=UPI0004DEE6B7|nr:hypothetical protein [Sciscionella sp. SE31]